MSPLPTGEDRPAKPVPIHKNVWLWAFLIGIVTITLMRPLLRREPAPPPVLGRLPAFELTATDGERFGPDALEGRAWVLGFFTVSGESPLCQGLLESMVVLERRYDEAGIEGVGLLGLSSEPHRDTPQLLLEFAETHALDPVRWILATGRPEEVRRLAARLAEARGDPTETPLSPDDPITHACRLVLLDGSGGIRGAYRDDTQGLDEIFHRSRHVLRANK